MSNTASLRINDSRSTGTSCTSVCASVRAYRYQYRKSGHWGATQKSFGNGKDLLHIHVSTAWVGRNHTAVRRYYTCAVTQIGVGSG